LIKVAAITSGRHVPSSRFRVRQHIIPLKAFGIEVHEYTPMIDKYRNLPFWPESWDYRYGLPLYLLWQGLKITTRIPGIIGSWRQHITWLERHMLPGMVTLEPILRKPLVFDVDDAIWLAPPFKTSAWEIAKRAEVLIAGNQYLAERFASYCRDVRVIPTAVDTNLYRPRSTQQQRQKKYFTIGWIGTSANLRYLEALEIPLRQFLVDHPDSKLLVMADKSPSFPIIPEDRIDYLPWAVDRELIALQGMDVGLMPLPDEEWSRGKCSFKMLQYLACGIPVVVSPVGMNLEILALGQVGMPCFHSDDWYETLAFFHNNRDTAVEYGRIGRGIVERHFSRERVTAKIADVFKSLL
jgi:glycosyltransferase involved in cell wall biosynthesis